MKVSLDIDLMKLDPHSERRGEVFSGEYKYFHFILDKEKDVTLVMTATNGEAKMYLNKGFNNLPTN